MNTFHIYLAGKITDKDPKQQRLNKARFYEKAGELRELGHYVYNPIEHEPDGKDNAYYYALDLKYIHENEVQAIYVMKGWENSLGTKIEIETAQLLGLRVIYER